MEVHFDLHHVIGFMCPTHENRLIVLMCVLYVSLVDLHPTNHVMQIKSISTTLTLLKGKCYINVKLPTHNSHSKALTLESSTNPLSLVCTK